MINSLHNTLSSAVLTLLRPLVRILLRNGVPYGAFAELAKKTFVDVAAEDFGEDGKKVTISRISALTGVTRKEAKRLQELASPEAGASRERYNRAVRVISGWVNDREFHDERGEPADLPVEGEQGSFSALVRRFSGDVPTKAMLTVLLAAGTVAQVDGKIRLINHAYIPGNDPVDKITILGSDAGELMATIDHNLTAASADLHFQRKVSNHALRDDAVNEFKRLSHSKAQALLEDLDDWLNRHEAAQGDEEQSSRYVSMGIYYFERKGSKGAQNE